MKSASELIDFYYTDLYDSLQTLEAERKQTQRHVLILFGVLGAITLSIILAVYAQCHCINDVATWSIFGAITLGGIGYRVLIKSYRSGFKERVIRPLIETIETNLRYMPHAKIPQALFNYSHLFQERIDRFEGNDLVEGSIDGVSLQFSDVHAQKRHKDSKGRISWTTVFKGLYIIAEFNKHFSGRTRVMPDLAEKYLGSFVGNMLQSYTFSDHELIKLDDPTFEKTFVVYGTDQIEARYILTHSMMERLLMLKHETQSSIYVSFAGEKIMIAIEYNKDLFEPTVFRSLLSVDQAMHYVRTLKYSIGIVEELKLNQKLWSKH